MPFRSQGSHRRDRRSLWLGCAALWAVLGAFAFPRTAGAAELVSLGIEAWGGKVECKVGSGAFGKCEPEYLEGKKLTLQAIPDKGYEFVGWEFGTGSAEGCAGTGSCVFFIWEESSVEAVFEPTTPSLAIEYPGVGEGEVECAVELGLPEPCEEEYEFGTRITLEPVAVEGSEFLGFKNGTGSAEECVGMKCSFKLEADSTIDAPFAPIVHALTVAKTGTGQGTVSCNGTTCAASYPEGSEVTLKATPAQGSSFAGWSGEGCSGTGSCVVTIEGKSASVTATFEANPQPPPPIAEGTAKAAAIAKVKSGRALVKLSCSGGPCSGTLKLTAKVKQGPKRKSVQIGKSPFSLAEGARKTLKVKLSSAAMRELKKAGSLKASAGGPNVLTGAVRLKLVT